MWRPPPSRLARSRRSLLLVTPWADQGLGIQAREYAHQAVAAGWAVHVWALPCRKTSPQLAQTAPTEWQMPQVQIVHGDAGAECVQYGQQHDITDVFVLEPSRPLFDLARMFLNAGLRVWAVPNLEMIRRADLPLFNYFTGVLGVNQHTVDNLNYFKVPNVQLMRFRLRDDSPVATPCATAMRFLVVGGFNADRRKQAKKVMLAFARAFRDRQDVHLTVLSQGGPDFAQIPRTFPNIQIRVGPLTYQQVLEVYSQHHVVVMCSRAEGLGLPFYEAARAGCAVLTLDIPMYRELVEHNVNGWLIKSSVEPIALGRAAIGNDDAIVHTYTFDPAILAQLLQTFSPQKIADAQSANRARYLAESRDNFFTSF